VNRILMVRPTAFAYHPEAAATNTFMREAPVDAVLGEFAGAVAALRAAGVTVEVLDSPEGCPDAVFPNNWFSTHEDGRMVVYSMMLAARRAERSLLREGAAFAAYPDVWDLTGYEDQARYLEGTGSLVLDRETQVAFACLSPRTDRELAERWADRMGYRLVLFEAFDAAGVAVYHTNVVMAVGSTWAVICDEACADASPVIRELRDLGKSVVTITLPQMSAFCGNILELDSGVAMSRTAYDAFRADQLEVILADRPAIVADIPTIETVGGGSFRCMIAEMA
jgi:hypothetical protein